MKKFLLILATALMVAACNDHTPQVVQQPVPQAQVIQQVPTPVATAPAPVIINQAPAQDHSMTSALTGAAVGYMLGSAGGRRDTVVHHYETAPVTRPVTQNVTVNKTVIVNQVAKDTPKPAAPVAVVPPVAVKSVPVSAAKIVPSAPSPVSASSASKLSLAKPAAPSSSFGGFNRRK